MAYKGWDGRERKWRKVGADERRCPRCLAVLRYYDYEHRLEDCIESLAERGAPEGFDCYLEDEDDKV